MRTPRSQKPIADADGDRPSASRKTRPLPHAHTAVEVDVEAVRSPSSPSSSAVADAADRRGSVTSQEDGLAGHGGVGHSERDAGTQQLPSPFPSPFPSPPPRVSPASDVCGALTEPVAPGAGVVETAAPVDQKSSSRGLGVCAYVCDVFVSCC